MILKWHGEKSNCYTHNAIVQNLTYNIDDQLDVRIAKFTHMCLNLHNDVCRFISLSKLLCKNSTFASNYRYLSYKYSLSHHDWHLHINHLARKVRLKTGRNRSTCIVIGYEPADLTVHPPPKRSRKSGFCRRYSH